MSYRESKSSKMAGVFSVMFRQKKSHSSCRTARAKSAINFKIAPRDNPNKCIDCGKIITNNKKVHRCRECYRKSQQKVANRPTKEQLYQELKETNFVQVGKNME